MKPITILFAACILLAGCATNVSSPEQASQGSVVNFDPYAGLYSVTGQQLDLGGFPNITKVWLSASFDKQGGSESLNLVVHHWSQTGWKFLSSAADINGVQLTVAGTRQDLGMIAGTVDEKVSIAVPRQYLDGHLSDGLDIRVLGRNGAVNVKVPGVYIAGFLSKFDSARAARH